MDISVKLKIEKNTDVNDVLSDILKVARKLSKSYITVKEYDKHGLYRSSEILGKYGAWKDALKKAGLADKDSGHRNLKTIPDDEMVSDIVRVANELGKNSVTRDEYDRLGKYGSHNIKRRFGSFTAATSQAELISPRYRKDISDNEILDDLKFVSQKLGGKYISQKEYNEHGKYSHALISRRFGSSDLALQRAGIPFVHTAWNKILDKLLLDDIKRVYVTVARNYITKDDYAKHGNYSIRAIERAFGTWGKALSKIGLKTGNERTGSERQIISNDKLFNNLIELWITLGRQPKSSELKPPNSKYRWNTYSNRFGNWNNTLLSFNKWRSNDSTDNDKQELSKCEGKIETPENKVNEDVYRKDTKRKTSRFPSPKQRWRVLERDNWTCQRCGAKAPEVKIEADHKISWDDGGETTDENLWALCSSCNLGKGSSSIYD